MKTEPLWTWKGLMYSAIAGFIFGACVGEVQAQDAPLHYLEREDVAINLMPGPCVDPRSSLMIATSTLPQETKTKFREIKSTWLMRDGSRMDYAGCWVEWTNRETAEEGFLVVFSDGQGGFIPKKDFNKRKGQFGT